MKVKIKETGEMLELIAIDADNGVEYTRDLIGNADQITNGQFELAADADYYHCDKSTFEWWDAVIADLNAAAIARREAKAIGVWTDDDDSAWYAIAENDVDTDAAARRAIAEAVLARSSDD